MLSIAHSCFSGQSLHSLDPATNPYKTAIEAVGRSLMPFDPEENVPTFGFGDFVSQASGLVSFDHSGSPLQGIDSVVTAYDQVVRKAHLSGPTNWAPAIRKAIQLVDASGGRFHVLVILTVSSVRFFVMSQGNL
jgi:E3 ubiquitin-protein ligase RGLG